MNRIRPILLAEVRLKMDPGPPVFAQLHDPFGALFPIDPATPPQEPLLDRPEVEEQFGELDWGMAEGLYTYQLPVESHAGARATVMGREYLMLSSYDYLGLSQHPAVMAAAIDAIRRHGVGTGGVRLLAGTSVIHGELEGRLAGFLGAEAALTFSSGYAANIGAIGTVVGPRDAVMLDQEAHKSLVAGCLQSRARIRRFRHNDPGDLDQRLRSLDTARNRLVVVEGVYSMDGDICCLPEMLEVAERHGASLMIDESHSLGTIGPEGRGAVAHFGLDPARIALVTASLAKTVPAGGGVVAASRPMVSYLQHRAGPFLFSAALAPAAAGGAIAALEVMCTEATRHRRLHRNAELLRTGLQALGFNTGASATAIVPVMIGAKEPALRATRWLLDAGVIASAAVPPAVSPGGARLRLCATSEMTEADIAGAINAFRDAGVRECLTP
jgi:glycine C-acetyltransferase